MTLDAVVLPAIIAEVPGWNRFPLDPRTRVLAVVFPVAICMGWLIGVLPDGPWWWPLLALLAWGIVLLVAAWLLQWRGWTARLRPPQHRR